MRDGSRPAHPGSQPKDLNERLLTVPATSWAYLAGIVDGEGHFSACRTSNVFGIVVKMAEPEVIRWLHGEFGGMTASIDRSAIGRRTLYRWSLQRGRDVRYACGAMLPFLVLKRDECEATLRYLNHTIDGRPCWATPTSSSSAAERARRREVMLQWKLRAAELSTDIATVRNARKALTKDTPLAA